MDYIYQRRIKKSKQKNEENNQHRNCFDHLPKEITIDIVSRLPITSIIPFSFVSRSLHSVSHDPLLANMHLSRSSTNESSYLILHSDSPVGNQLHFLQPTDQKIRKIDIPFASSMPQFNIIGSCDGLLCLVDSSFPESVYLYNPFTRDYRELRKNFFMNHTVDVYGFGHHPITNDWKLIKIHHCSKNSFAKTAKSFREFQVNSRHISEVQLYSSSSNTWTHIGFVPYGVETWSSPGVLVNGRLHWISRWDKYDGERDQVIVSYNLANDSFHEIRKPSGPVWKWGTSCHLVNLNGCLSAAVPVSRSRYTIDIWIMKEYGSDKSWVKGYSFQARYPEPTIVHEGDRLFYSVRNLSGGKFVRILGMMKNGEVLMEHGGDILLSYDPRTKALKEWRLEGLPTTYRATALVGSLKSAAAFPL